MDGHGPGLACRPKSGNERQRRARDGLAPSLALEPAAQAYVVPPTIWRSDMLKGGLLWLIGIPLPIILILFFLGYLS
jgi:hypothetical protein